MALSIPPEVQKELDRLRRENEEVRRENEEVKRENEEVRHENEEIKHRLEPTDYTAYLSLSHAKLFSSLEVEEKSTRTSAMAATNVDGKYYPCYLKKWTGFPSLHDRYQKRLRDVFGVEKRFRPAFGMDVIKDFFSQGPVADEQDMRRFQFFAVEAGTQEIIKTYLDIRRSSHNAAEQPNLPAQVRFFNSPYGLLSEQYTGDEDPDTLPAYVPPMTAASERQKEIERERETRSSNRIEDEPPPTKRQTLSTRPKLYPDQWCFRVDWEGVYVPIFVVEYKAAHKLTKETLKMALETNAIYCTLFADVMQDIHSNKIPTDEGLKTQNEKKRETARVITQAFHYMVEFGLCYSYVASGEGLLLLHMDPDDVTTLYYHLAIPGEDIGEFEAGSEAKLDKVEYSALALVATLVLLALDTEPLSQRWKTKAEAELQKWDTRYAAMLPDSNTSSFQSSLPSDEDEDKDSDGNKDYEPPKCSGPSTRTIATRSKSQHQQNESAGSGSSGRGGRQRTALPYCTQDCLLGLRNEGPLDPRCPNVELHRQSAASANKNGSRPDCHPLTASMFLVLLREQLAHDLDDNCEGLDRYGKFGATSMLFRLTLQPYGYSLVAKGVQRGHARPLLSEMEFYDNPRVSPLMGRLIPVCLGFLSLVRPYIAYTGARVTHMLLLSYCGEPVLEQKSAKNGPDLPDDIDNRVFDAWRKLRQLGIEHNDEQWPNVVWNTERQEVMCIDFGQAEVKTMQPHFPSHLFDGRKRQGKAKSKAKSKAKDQGWRTTKKQRKVA